MRVLIADDEPVFREYLKAILTGLGYSVHIAVDGNEAWQALHGEDPPQVAILDWMMPELGGVDICRKIREEERERYTYLILLTGRRDDADMIAGMEAGADDYITKPFNVSELRVRIKAGARVIELQNQLVDAQKTLTESAWELEELNRNIEGFSYAVAKDLLQSLQGIASDAKAVQQLICTKMPPSVPCVGYTKRIYERTKALGETIAMMHEYLKPARTEMRRGQTDLTEIAQSVAYRLQAAEPQRHVEWRIGEGIIADADRDLLRVVLENLFDNAWKFTSRREDPAVEFGMIEKGDEKIYFVRDNGIGFDMSYADKIFIPFFRVPGSESFAEDSPPGIGLATVERIIRRHGGKIWAEGEPEKGATFSFTLGRTVPHQQQSERRFP